MRTSKRATLPPPAMQPIAASFKASPKAPARSAPPPPCPPAITSHGRRPTKGLGRHSNPHERGLSPHPFGRQSAPLPLSAPPLVDTPAPATQYVAALSIVQPARSRCSSSSAGAPAGHTLGPQVSSSDASMRGRTKKAGGGEWCAAARCKPTNSNAYKQTIHSRAPMSRTHHRRSGNLSPSLHTACRRPTVPGAVGRPWLC